MPLTHNLITQNDKTNEQLVFDENYLGVCKCKHIGRCPSAENGQKWVKKLNDWIYDGYSDRSITISTPKLRYAHFFSIKNRLNYKIFSSIDETMEESKGGEDKEEVDLGDCKIWEILRMN